MWENFPLPTKTHKWNLHGVFLTQYATAGRLRESYYTLRCNLGVSAMVHAIHCCGTDPYCSTCT
eukprot:COSAG02_NODE_18_length_54986_cov_345.599322_27_plen_64_part_00